MMNQPNPPKYIDLCGPEARLGGIDAVQAARPSDRVYLYVQRRLQVLAKIMNQSDPTKLVEMNFEALLQAIEQMTPTATLTFDHHTLRGLDAMHTGGAHPRPSGLGVRVGEGSGGAVRGELPS